MTIIKILQPLVPKNHANKNKISSRHLQVKSGQHMRNGIIVVIFARLPTFAFALMQQRYTSYSCFLKSWPHKVVRQASIVTNKAVIDKSFVEDRVCKDLQERCELREGSTALLCVSGGADSVAMLHILANLNIRLNMKINLEIIHFNHKLREESDEEEEFVNSIARRYSLPIHIRHLPQEKRHKVGLQSTARIWRRTECLQLRQQYLLRNRNKSSSSSDVTTDVITDVTTDDDYFICTAHHADDQLETSILKLLRGTHLSRLYPMLPRNGPFVKPLLSISKVELLHYLTQHNYEWREDKSNTQRTYKRNKIRLDVIPCLETVSGGNTALKRRFDELSEQSQHLREWIAKESSEFLSHHNNDNNNNNNNNNTTMMSTSPPSVSPSVSVSIPFPLIRTGLKFNQLPELVKSDLVHTFVYNSTGMALSYQRVVQIVALVAKGSGSVGIQSVSLSDMWEISSDGTLLVMRTRGIRRNEKNAVVFGDGERRERGRGKVNDTEIDTDIDADIDTVVSRWVMNNNYNDNGINSVSDGNGDAIGSEGERNHREQRGLYMEHSPELAVNVKLYFQDDSTTLPAAISNDTRKTSDIVLYNIPYNSTLKIRCRKDGDKFLPQGRNMDYFRSQQLSPLEREFCSLIAMENKLLAVATDVTPAHSKPLPSNNKCLVAVINMERKISPNSINIKAFDEPEYISHEESDLEEDE
eukprot:gene750-1434_t